MLASVKEFFNHDQKKIRDDRWIFTSMLIGAILSLIASFVLSAEAVELAGNPGAELSCSVNAVLNCATVALHPTATMFGFPNSFLGMIAEPIVITVAIAGLAGVKFPRRFMYAAQIGYTLGLIFALYLFYVSFFIIQALCPWCLLVTATTIFVWFAITRYNIREENLYLSKSWSKKATQFIERDYDKLAMFSILLIIVAAILIKYGNALFA